MAEIYQLPNQDSQSLSESESRILGLIEATRNISQFSTTLIESSHPNSEVEFGYYAQLSEARDVGEFEKKIGKSINALGFDEFSYCWSASAESDVGRLINISPHLLKDYFYEQFYEQDLILPYASSTTEPIYHSTLHDYAASAPLTKKLTASNGPSDELIGNSVGHLFEACAKRSGNSEILLRVENASDRLNYIRICEARMQAKSEDPLLLILQYGAVGDYAGLRTELNTQFDLSLRLLPHVMRQGIFPVVPVIEELVVASVIHEPKKSWR